ncbi:CBS domain-containing protein [Fimbriiglobus ruber]|uniref:Mg/Co/Ni transporter MgtE / CBS domain n=1 Tax=Fimbriiglobus ruber TaxID=1908690 RepID=A0A225DGJ4_9BACT|nr:CBS domain-containing protein [Fimbriiglobus ruber]OWK37648.1 Mg/Co/Ni transporter MgtE / CBS domain [Fimbriiglobus ruber]
MTASHATERILNDPVALHVRREITALSPDWSVGEALDHMRRTPPPGRVIYFYVTDSDGRLVGVVPTRRLLFAPPETRVADVMIRHVVTIPEAATVLEACEFFTLHRFLAFPVVDADRKFIGMIDVELYTGELAGELGADDPNGAAAARVGDDVFEIIGVHLTAAAQANPGRAFWGRFPWLLCNIAGGLVAAGLASFYDDVLTWKGAVLSLFIPVVLALSESVAIQSVTLTVGRFRAGTGDRKRQLRSALTEGATGALLGASTAGVVALVAAIWLRDAAVASVLFGAIGAGVAVSTVVGFAVPTLLHQFRLNPQVAAGPISLASADMLTLLIYFNLARTVL